MRIHTFIISQIFTYERFFVKYLLFFKRKVQLSQTAWLYLCGYRVHSRSIPQKYPSPTSKPVSNPHRTARPAEDRLRLWYSWLLRTAWGNQWRKVIRYNLHSGGKNHLKKFLQKRDHTTVSPGIRLKSVWARTGLSGFYRDVCTCISPRNR